MQLLKSFYKLAADTSSYIYNSVRNSFYNLISYFFPKNSALFELGKEGDVSPKAMKVACAGIATQSKSKNFNPTVLSDDHEFQEFLNYIHKNKDLLRKSRNTSFKFLFHDSKISHWLCGAIDISEEKTKILIIDSVGKTYFNRRTSIAPYLANFAHSNKDTSLIISESQTQRGTDLCAIFALETVRKLYKLQNSIIENLTQLNPSMLRVTESITFLKNYYDTMSEASRVQAINKGGVTFERSINMHIKMGQDRHGRTKLLNKRIVYKQEKICQKVAGFFAARNVNHVEICESFSLNALKSKMR